MIQPETLEAINYFFDMEIECYEDRLLTECDSEKIEAFYRGYLVAIKYARHTVNLDFIDSTNTREIVQPQNVETVIIPVRYGGKLPVAPERE